MSIQLAPGAEPVPNYRLVKFLGKGGFGQVWEAVAPGGTQRRPLDGESYGY